MNRRLSILVLVAMVGLLAGCATLPPPTAKQLADSFETEAPDIAYELRIAPDGANLQWVERSPSGGTVVYDVDPETSAWQRMQVGFLAGLPIDWLL